jgi:hypothetical protein
MIPAGLDGKDKKNSLAGSAERMAQSGKRMAVKYATLSLREFHGARKSEVAPVQRGREGCERIF